MKDRVSLEEAAHDKGLNIEPYMKEAVDHLIWKLFDGQKVNAGRYQWALGDFLQENASRLPALVEGHLIAENSMKDAVEYLLRAKLTDSEEAIEMAEELARDADYDARGM